MDRFLLASIGGHLPLRVDNAAEGVCRALQIRDRELRIGPATTVTLLATGVEIALGIAAIASAGVSIAGAAGAFDQDAPSIPQRDGPSVEAARQRRLRAARSATGRGSTILTPLTEDSPQTRGATLLGQAAPRKTQ